jgi:O-antigen/teichoic acid export membrane protein
MNNRVLVATNTVSQLIGRIFSTGATFLITILIASSLGPQGYGDFTKITTFIAVFYLLADFGLNAIFLREESNNTISWSTFLGARIFFSTLLAFLAIALLSFLPSGDGEGYPLFIKIGIILYAPTIIFQSLILSANALFQKHLRYDLATLAVGIGSCITLAAVGVSMYVFQPAFGILSAVVGLSIGSATIGIVSLFFARRFSPLSPSFRFGAIRSLLVQSLPLGMTLLFNVVYFRADSFIMALTRSTSDVGIYGYAYKFFEFALALPTFFMNALYPLLLASYAKDKHAFVQLCKRASILLFVGSLVGAVAIWVGAPLIGFVKVGFELSVLPLRILGLGLPFFFISNLLMWILIVYKKQYLLLFVYGITMVINILLNIAFVPAYGYVASAIITGVSELLVLVLLGISLLSIKRSMHTKKEEGNL